jgi:epoxyqueuosine reductase
MDLAERLRQIASDSGLDLVGFASAEAFEDYRWQDSFMRNPKLTLADAQSILVVGVNELKFLKDPEVREPAGHVARSYAAGHEYNLVDGLIPLKRFLQARGHKALISPGSIAESTIPLKLAAVRAGLGWQGKHSVVITPEFGSWVSFGALLTDAFLDRDRPLINKHCGVCRLCMDACPTGAIKAPYVVDKDLCLDEILNSRGLIPDGIKDKVGHRVLSCDTCLEVCPHSLKILKKTALTGKGPYRFSLLKLLNLEEQQFKSLFGRLGWSIDFVHFKRNVIVALGNCADRSSIRILEGYRGDESDVLRDAAAWALERRNLSG